MKKLVFALVVFASATPLCVLANGSGYNGPDLNPVSIPVQLDRGISLTSVGAAITVCMAAGDKDAGLQSLLQKLALQMGSESADLWTNRIEYGSPGAIGIHQISTKWIEDGKAYQSSVNQRLSDLKPSLKSSIRFDVINSPQMEGVVLASPEAVLFPVVTYDEVLDEGNFDDFGRLNIGSRIVAGLKVKFFLPAEFKLAEIPLINERTNRTTRFTVNAEEYIQCLQSRLQQNASE